MSAAARSALSLLLRRRLPAETDRRLRDCLDALPPGGDSGDIYTAAGDGSAIYKPADPSGDGAAIYGKKGKPDGDGGAICSPEPKPRSVTNWFGASDEYF